MTTSSRPFSEVIAPFSSVSPRGSRLVKYCSPLAKYRSFVVILARPRTISRLRRLEDLTWLSRYKNKPNSRKLENTSRAKRRFSKRKADAKILPMGGNIDTEATPAETTRTSKRSAFDQLPFWYLRKP